LKDLFHRIISSRIFRLGLGLLISGLALYLVFKDVDFVQVWDALREARWDYIGLALLSVAVNTLAKALRWKVLVGPDGQEISILNYLGVLLVGQMLNTLFPARMGDLSRAYVLGGMGPGRTYVFGTVILEKVLDSFSYAMLFFLLLVLIPLPGWMSQSIFVFTAVILVVSAAVVILAYQPARVTSILDRITLWLPVRFQNWLQPRLRAGYASLEIVRRRSDFNKLVFWSVVVWGTALLTNHLTLLAFDIRLPFTASLLILIGLQAGISIPSVPGRIGIFEYICVLALTLFNVEQILSVSYGILLHAIVLVPSTLLGLVAFWLLGLTGKQDSFRKDMV
jgi:uncharacterized protein (TIRG00374 family)